MDKISEFSMFAFHFLLPAANKHFSRFLQPQI